MTLMLGDHQYSSEHEDERWKTDWEPFANTYSKDWKDRQTGDVIRVKGSMKQKLDEHLVRVTKAAVNVSHLLPAFESQLQTAQDTRPLRKPSPPAFSWQNRAVDALHGWRDEHAIDQNAFFAVNMASTGKGKTFANAKIMNAISPQGLRYSLALGLRTLTLQTGDEYRNKLKLDENELAVLIGSAAVRLLHQQRTISEDSGEVSADKSGSESIENLSVDYEFAYEDLIPKDAISTTLRDKKSRQLLKSPVLVCTVDHLMPAVENTRGGKQILPMLRMLSADLVIDEVDDFDHTDIPAIARLVHLAGMLGRKVMISSATIPPAIAQGLFHAYREGWCQFARFRNRSLVVTGFWVDEYTANISRIMDDDEFSTHHENFISKRLKNLAKEPNVRCRAKITPMPIADTAESRSELMESSQTLSTMWFSSVTEAAIHLHRHHCWVDASTGKKISMGVIRMANVDPCIDMSKHLLRCNLPNDMELRTMPYHARQVLLLRSEQEKHLDGVLNRKGDRCPLTNPILRRHVDGCEKPNLMFVVVASPVAEVGRDHDFDWAVVEPSSMRSIIQMAGRIMRHRMPADCIKTANVVLPNLNYKAFTTSNAVVFQRPGFEGGQQNRGGRYVLETKRLSELLDEGSLAERLDASARIYHSDPLYPTSNLADLEHAVLRNILTAEDHRPAFIRGWTENAYYLTDVSQLTSRFRESAKDSSYKLHVTDENELQFRTVELNASKSDGPQGKLAKHILMEELAVEMSRRLWLRLDYASLIQQQRQRLGVSRRRACELFGELRLNDSEGDREFEWTSFTGASRDLKTKQDQKG